MKLGFEKTTTRRRASGAVAIAAGSALLLACSGETKSADEKESAAPTVSASSQPPEGYNCGEKRAGDTSGTAKVGDVAIKFCYGGEGSTIVATSAGPRGEASHDKVGTYHGEEGAESESAVSCQVLDGRAVEMPGTGEETDIWYKIAKGEGVPGVAAEFVPDAFVKIDVEKAAHLPVCDTPR